MAKKKGCFHFLPTASAYDSVDYLLLESQESVAEKLTTTLQQQQQQQL